MPSTKGCLCRGVLGKHPHWRAVCVVQHTAAQESVGVLGHSLFWGKMNDTSPCLSVGAGSVASQLLNRLCAVGSFSPHSETAL